MSDSEVERALSTGSHAPELEAYFGAAHYAELQQLAMAAQSRSLRAGRRVLILPGLMGSKLGVKGKLFQDVIWFDPVDVALGHLNLLTLPAGAQARLDRTKMAASSARGSQRPANIEALGVMLFAYLKLKLKLRLAGFDAEYYAFDWRKDISQLGAELSAQLAREPPDVALVAHSMGGLVARAALKTATRSPRLIMLGTPNYGTFDALQALRGTHVTARRIAALVPHLSAQDLARDVYVSFPGLCQLLPAAAKWDEIDLFNAAEWPAGPKPRASLLKLASQLPRLLAEPEAAANAQNGWVLIAGINQETVVAAKRSAAEFSYETSYAGDGTVPLAFAQLPHVPTYFVAEEHGSLPNNSDVERAVIELLNAPTTTVLPTTWELKPRGRVLPEPAHLNGDRAAEVEETPDRELLREFVAPPVEPAVVALAPVPIQFPAIEQVVIGRRKGRRLELVLAQGNITDADASAYVMGIFANVTPAGAALEIDKHLNGAVAEFTQRRLLSGRMGQIFVIPVGRSTLRTEMVLFAGLGAFDSFSDEVQQLVAENVVRMFARTRVDDFATLLFGAASGKPITNSLANMLAGFVRGLAEADSRQHFRRITLCERDPERYAELKRALLTQVIEHPFADVELTITEEVLSPTFVAQANSAPRPAIPVYLMVRQSPCLTAAHSAHKKQQPEKPLRVALELAVLGVDGKAAVYNETIAVEVAKLDALLDQLQSYDFSFAGLPEYGKKLADLVVPPGVRQLLSSMSDRHTIIVHDAPSSRIPWETLQFAEPGLPAFCPTLLGGVTRRYFGENLSIAKWFEERRNDAYLDVLLVYNPTEDLPGADAEGQRLHAALRSEPRVRIRVVAGRDATRARLLREFASKTYDVIHYAGHAFFNADAPEKSGILCAGHQVLAGTDLVSLSSLPSLIVFNACEAARLRRGEPTRASTPGMKQLLTRTVSFAEAFLRGGATNYIGTYWPVNDTSATLFAATLYRELLAGSSVSSALLKARRELHANKLLDWADYIHYGNPDFVVKHRDPALASTPPSVALEPQPVTAKAPRKRRSKVAVRRR